MFQQSSNNSVYTVQLTAQINQTHLNIIKMLSPVAAAKKGRRKTQKEEE